MTCCCCCHRRRQLVASVILMLSRRIEKRRAREEAYRRSEEHCEAVWISLMLLQYCRRALTLPVKQVIFVCTLSLLSLLPHTRFSAFPPAVTRNLARTHHHQAHAKQEDNRDICNDITRYETL